MVKYLKNRTLQRLYGETCLQLAFLTSNSTGWITHSRIIRAQEAILPGWRRQEACTFINFRCARSVTISFTARLICSIIIVLLRTPKRNHAG
jgi:hypothetical protein